VAAVGATRDGAAVDDRGREVPDRDPVRVRSECGVPRRPPEASGTAAGPLPPTADVGDADPDRSRLRVVTDVRS
jgi:hypothetical protein